MTNRRFNKAVTRRTTLAAMVGGGLGLAAMAGAGPAAAQEAAGTLADHPLVGAWAVMTPGGIVPQIHSPDGSVVVAFPANYIDPMLGLTFQGPALGRWEADGERTGHFTVIQALSDASGVYLGTLLFEGYPEVSDDGQTFIGAKPQRVVMFDAENNVTFDQMLPMDPPVTAARLGSSPDSLVLPVLAPPPATPTT